MAVKKTKKKVKAGAKKKKLQVPSRGCAYIYSSYNNTIVTLTDQNGNAISWSSAGKCGFKGPKKATAYAAQVIVRDAVSSAVEKGLKEVSAFVRGVGTGRESAIRALNACGLVVLSIKDVTPVIHNGCRAKRPRRV